jgi:gliding motility-associated-like protein
LHWLEIYNGLLSGFAKHILSLIPIFLLSAASAMTLPPKAIRACLDPTTGVVTLYFTPQNNGCGSFVSYRLYGRDNAIVPYQFLFEGGVAGSTSISATLPNKKQWELFVSARFACNGTDTLNSDTILIDNQPPAMLVLDSVSVDLASQRVISGWKKAPEPDVMGYSVFRVDPGTGNNVLVKDTGGLAYWFNTSTFDSRNPGHKISIAVFDSCKNGGVICLPHSPVCSSVSPAENTQYRCNRKLLLRWTAYVGWPVHHYDVWCASSRDNLFRRVGSVLGDTLQFTHSLPELNQTFTYFVRAINGPGQGTITSTSNVVLFFAADFAKPLTLDIGHASVVAPGNIAVSYSWNPPLPVGFKALLQYKDVSGASWTTTNNNLSAGFGQQLITGLETSRKRYEFRLLAQNPCGLNYDTSVAHVSLLLTRLGSLAQWVDYQPYNPVNQVLEKRLKQGSTWNNVGGPSSPYFITDTSEAGCYRVVAYKTDNNNNRIDTAYSNEVCLRVYDTTLVPNAFSPDGNNRFFRIVNPNIEKGQATMYIYNRWGGKLWQGEALDGWNGEAFGQPVIQGFYIYKIEVFRPEKRELFQGTLMLLR